MSSRTDVASALPAQSPGVLLGTLWELSKPGITGMVVITMLCGALTAPASIPLPTLLLALLGTASVVAASNALNMLWERDTDALMRRTCTRPLPSGRLNVETAALFALVTAVAGFLVLYYFVGELPAVLTLLAFASYVLVYTPLKRVSPIALFVGAIPGAIPPLVGWASVTGAISPLAWILFGILFVWQLPHFLAIAIFRTSDYARAGMRVLPVVHGVRRTKVELVLYSLVLVVVSLLPVALGLVGFGYLAVALVSGLVFLWMATAGFSVADDARWARRVFFASMPYLVIVFGALSLFAAL